MVCNCVLLKFMQPLIFNLGTNPFHNGFFLIRFLSFLMYLNEL